MKIKYFLITLILIISVSISCRKDRAQIIRTKVSGKVTDYDSGAPVNNATITILELNTEEDSPFYIPMDSINTNENGDYEFKFHAKVDDRYFYMIHVRKEPEGYDLLEGVLNKKHSNTINAAVKGYSYLKLHIKNTSPFNGDDYIKVTVSPNIKEIPDFHCYGTNVNTYVEYTAKGSVYFKINWHTYKSGINKYYLDSIYCHSLTTVDYYLNY